MVGICHLPNLRKPADSSYSRPRRISRRSEVRAGTHASAGYGDAARALLRFHEDRPGSGAFDDALRASGDFSAKAML